MHHPVSKLDICLQPSLCPVKIFHQIRRRVGPTSILPLKTQQPVRVLENRCIAILPHQAYRYKWNTSDGVVGMSIKLGFQELFSIISAIFIPETSCP